MSRKKNISNWGNYPRIEAEQTALEYSDELSDFVRQQPDLLARGNGRCYGDAALHDRLFSSLRLNKMLDFDTRAGELECQSGVLFSDILALIMPQGFFLPVTPGTKFITLGGAIAADVHGKNHHSEGCFSRHLISFELMNGQGEQLHCSRQSHPELFWNTIGGMGLTGIILSARFRLKRIQTAYLRQERLKAPNLAAIMQLFEASANWTYTVAWIDCLQRGEKRGRSILFRGEHALPEELSARQQQAPLRPPSKRSLSVPFYLPSFTLNTFSVKAFNWLYYHRQRQPIEKTIVDYDTFFYPLDMIHHWNRIYGRGGFTQYQLVLPKAQCAEGLAAILDCIRSYGQGSFLCVLKLFGPKAEEAPHSFPIEGYTLALDFKISKNIRRLIAELDKLVVQYGGKVYLAKDAFSDKKLSGIKYDFADAKFTSVQRKRLE